MTNEQIRAACERAEGLAASVNDDQMRIPAFRVILQSLLIGRTTEWQQSQVETELSRKPKPPLDARRLGLKARLIELHSQGFFTTQRAVPEIAAELKTSGWNHQNKVISARVIELTRDRTLRRVERSDGKKRTYLYSNW